MRQNSGETAVSGKLRTWESWSSKNAWVSRANARDTWLARVTDEQILANVKACQLAITTRVHDFLTSTDSAVFLRGARAFTLQYPPVQRVADVSERIEDLSDLSDAYRDHENKAGYRATGPDGAYDSFSLFGFNPGGFK